ALRPQRRSLGAHALCHPSRGRAFVAGLATLHFARGEYPAARLAAERAVALKPHYTFARALAVASAWLAGERNIARDHLARLRVLDPSYSGTGFRDAFGASVPAVEAFSDALQLAMA
ncbi:MAG: hypothetical protein ACI9MR_000518, partial [Myxococcota bacterium]